MNPLANLRKTEHADWAKLEQLAADEAKLRADRDKILARIHQARHGTVPPVAAGIPQPRVMSIVMFDDVTVSLIPPSPQAVAGYVGGRFANFDAMVKAFPHAFHLSIAVNAGEDADCLDCEPGDATPEQVVGWIKRQLARGVWRPCVYAGEADMAVIIPALKAAGIARGLVRLWLAKWTGVLVLTPGYDAQQITDHADNRSLDESICLGSFFKETT